MDTIIKECEELDVSWLEPTLGDFRLVVEKKALSSTVYSLFYYTNDANWRWWVLYDKEVGDYMVRIMVPLVDFVDIAFVRESLASFMDNLKANYKASIIKRFLEPQEGFVYEYKKKGIPQWNYTEVLPQTVEGYHLDVTPLTALDMINGSYVIATYIKDNEETGVVLFYNTFRDEFFGETRQQDYPGITHDLDATTIDKFEQAIRNHLQDVLQSL
jgi:hypothetical protein